VPDGAAAVVGYVEAAVVGYGYSHGAPVAWPSFMGMLTTS
jgi:hypothetical protein